MSDRRPSDNFERSEAISTELCTQISWPVDLIFNLCKIVGIGTGNDRGKSAYNKWLGVWRHIVFLSIFVNKMYSSIILILALELNCNQLSHIYLKNSSDITANPGRMKVRILEWYHTQFKFSVKKFNIYFMNLSRWECLRWRVACASWQKRTHPLLTWNKLRYYTYKLSTIYMHSRVRPPLIIFQDFSNTQNMVSSPSIAVSALITLFQAYSNYKSSLRAMLPIFYVSQAGMTKF